MSSSNLINLMTLIWNLPLNFDVAFCNWLDKFLPPTATYETCKCTEPPFFFNSGTHLHGYDVISLKLKALYGLSGSKWTLG